MKICSSCNQEQPETNEFCGKCGSSLTLSDVDVTIIELDDNNNVVDIGSKREARLFSKKKLQRLVLSIFIVLCIGVGGGLYYNHLQNIKESREAVEVKSQYEEDLMSVVMLMLNESGKAENMINNYLKIWNASIQSDYGLFITAESKTSDNIKYEVGDTYKKSDNYAMSSDFNKALSIVNNIYIKHGSNASLTANKEDIESRLQKLASPPEELKSFYDIVVQIYNDYSTYISLAISPNGSMRSFNDNTTELSGRIVSKIGELQVRFPLKEESNTN